MQIPKIDKEWDYKDKIKVVHLIISCRIIGQSEQLEYENVLH